MISHDILIFGAGFHARRLARGLQSRHHEIHAFVTSRPASLSSIDGIPVHCLESLPQELRNIDSVAVGVFNRSDCFEDIASCMASHGFAAIYWPWDYYPYIKDSLGWCYWLDPEPKLLSQWKRESSYRQVHSLLSDDDSKELLDRILSFRSGQDLPFSAFQSKETQYFNQLTLSPIALKGAVSYLDVGAFNGDTLLQLCLRAPVGSAVLLEPDPDNYKSLVGTISTLVDDYPLLRPLPLPLGAGNAHGTFSLCGEGEAATLNPIADEGAENHTVTVVRLDDLMSAGKVDFVKIDVEGYDLAALQGMEALLRRSAPVVAISVYHRPHDILDLPLYLSSILSGLDYRYYIRQHMFNSFDTVLYAVPF